MKKKKKKKKGWGITKNSKNSKRTKKKRRKRRLLQRYTPITLVKIYTRSGLGQRRHW